MADENKRSNHSPSEIRAFFAVSVAIGLNTYGIIFDLLVFENIAYERIFFMWILSLVMLLGSWVLPEIKLSWVDQVILAIPTVSIIGTIWVHNAGNASPNLNTAITLLNLVMLVIALPYAVLVGATYLSPEIETMRKPRLIIGLVLVTVVSIMAGVVVGNNYPAILTCEDFELSGAFVPERCIPLAEMFPDDPFAVDPFAIEGGASE